MDKSKRKELVSEWKERKPEMGIISVRCIATGEEFLGITRDTSTGFNRHRFQLSAKLHRNKELQKLWDIYGESGFEYTVTSILDYEDIAKVQNKDLDELLELCLIENTFAQRL